MKASWGISLLLCALGLVLLLSGSLLAQQAAVDVSGSWRGGHYKLSQNGDVVTSAGDFGHADGHFTGAHTFTMSWASATWNATVSADGNRIDWNNNSTWFRDAKSQDVQAQKTGAFSAQPATELGETAGLAASNPSQPPATQQAASSSSLPGSTWAGAQTQGTKSLSAQGFVSGNSRSTLHTSPHPTAQGAARSSRPARPSTPDPVHYLDIDIALAQGKSSHGLAAEVTARGTDLIFDDEQAEYLRLLGTTDELLSALRTARYVFVGYDTPPAESEAIASRDEVAARQILTRRPDDPALHWLLALALQIEQKPSDAIPEARRAVQLKPDLACAHHLLAELLLDTSQREEALTEARAAVRLMPNVPNTHMTLAAALFQTGDQQAASQEFRQAVQVAPDDWGAHSALAFCLLSQKDYDGAAHEFREAVRLYPDFAQAHFGLGRTLMAKKDFDGAAFEFKEALRLYPKYPSIHNWLASALISSVLAAHPDWAARASASDMKAREKANNSWRQASAASDRGNFSLAASLDVQELQLETHNKVRSSIFLRLGNAFEKQGDLNDEYDAYILTTPPTVPGNRVLMPALLDDKATQAAQALSDYIQYYGVAREDVDQAFLALARIMASFDRAREAQAFQEEARIRKEAEEAFDASMNSNAGWMANCEAEAKVFDRENRPELAAEMRAYGEARAGEHSGEIVGSQANQSRLSLILQGLAFGMSEATMARNVAPPSPQRVPMESRAPVQPNMPARQTAPSQRSNAGVSPNPPGGRAPTPGSTTSVPNRPVAPSTGRNYPPPTPGSNTTPNTSTGIAGGSGGYAPGTTTGYCNPGDGLGNTCSGSSRPSAPNNVVGPPTGGWVNGDRPNSGGPLLSSANLSPAPNVSNAVPAGQPSVDASAQDTSDSSGVNQMAGNSDSNNDSGGGNSDASDATPGSTGADSGWTDPLMDPSAPSDTGLAPNPSPQEIAGTLDAGISNSGETSATPVATVAGSDSWDAFSSALPSDLDPSSNNVSPDATTPSAPDAADAQIDLAMENANAIRETLGPEVGEGQTFLPTNEVSQSLTAQGIGAEGAVAHQMNHIVNDLESAVPTGDVTPGQINADLEALPSKLQDSLVPDSVKSIQEDLNKFQNDVNYVTKQVHSASCLFFYTSSCQ